MVVWGQITLRGKDASWGPRGGSFELCSPRWSWESSGFSWRVLPLCFDHTHPLGSQLHRSHLDSPAPGCSA